MNVLKVAGTIYLLLATILLVCAQHGSNQSSQWNSLEDDPRFDARVSELLAKNMLQLAQELGTTILQDSDKATEVFSPLSIYTALSILLMGANGQTFQELMSLLKINSGNLLTLFLYFKRFFLDSMNVYILSVFRACHNKYIAQFLILNLNSLTCYFD